jgi:hypothetical protein
MWFLIWIWKKIMSFFRKTDVVLTVETKPKSVLIVSQIKMILWENKYDEKYEKLENKKLTKEDKDKLLTSILFEKTPNHGNVIIMYDNKHDSFIYYCDYTPSYLVLKNVVKKYVCLYDCKELYENKDEEEDKEEINKEDKVIVKKDKLTSVKTVIDNNNYTKMEINIKSPVKIKNQIIIKNNTIRLTHLGKLSNFCFLKKDIKKKKLSYREYKQKLNQ